jgi:glutathione peroxidase
MGASGIVFMLKGGAMTLLLNSPAARKRRAILPITPWRAAALASALGVCTAGCKTNEVAKAPDSAAPGEAAAESATPAVAPAPAVSAVEAASPPTTPSIYPLEMKRLDGTETSLSAWSGKVLLIVNTASKCGYTPQYQGLQQLHAKYSERGFEVLGFPSNDFGGQEPGTAKEISTFCISIYDVNFPMFEKTKTIGKERSPLYALLSDAYGEPKWNFHKYLIDKQGRPIQAWPSKVEPGSPEITSAIEAQLAAL